MRTLALILLAAILAGCGEGENQKTSHFEHDHEMPDHWPNDLADSALKIRDRLSMHQRFPDLRSEMTSQIIDIVSWVPEIAADTDLTEEEWIPIDQQVQSLSKRLAQQENMDNDHQQLAKQLCDLIEQSAALLKEDAKAEGVSE